MDTFKAAPTLRVVPFVYRPEMSVYEILCKMTDSLNETIRVVDTLDLEALDADIAALAELLEQIGSTDYPETIAAINSAIDALESYVHSAGFVGTSNIADGAVTLAKMSDGNKRNMWSYSAQFVNKNAVFFGDSFVAPNIDNSEQGYLANTVCSVLGMEQFNYAVAGAGFARPTNLISAQQATAASDMTADEKADTAIVVCVAGINDLMNVDAQSITQSMIVDGMHSFLSFASSTFPNARIVIVPFNWGFGHLTRQLSRLVTNAMNSIHTTMHGHGCIMVPYAWCWNLGLATRFRNSTHPNQTGYRVYVNHILNALMGAETNDFMVGEDVAITSEAVNQTSQRFAYTSQMGMVNMHGFIRPVAAHEAVEAETTLMAAGTMPPITTPNTGIFCMPLTSSTTGKNAGYLLTTNTGELKARFTDVAANEVCNFNSWFTAEVGVSWNDYN